MANLKSPVKGYFGKNNNANFFTKRTILHDKPPIFSTNMRCAPGYR
jgi:hypothetical protein